jgi:group I intron endonuclease
LVNGKFYIGSSNNIEHRWECHKRNLRNKKHDNLKFQHAWNFYGEDKFQFDIIEEVINPTEMLLLEREQHHIDLWKPYHRTIGYNICPTVSGGDNITHNPNRDDFIKIMRKVSMGENNPMFGKKHTEESIKKQKHKAIGRYSLDWFIVRYGTNEGTQKFHDRNEMLKNRKINYSYDNGLSGKKRGPMSEEIKKRISERKAKLKIIRPDLHKDIISNEYTMMQLANKYGTSISTIKNEKRKLIK